MNNSLISVFYCDVYGGWPGEGNIASVPGFVDQGSWDTNGTPEDMMDDIWTMGDYHLTGESKCIDAGIDVGEYRDFEGNARPLDGNHDGLVVADIGAYEFVAPNIRPMAEAGEDLLVWAEPNGVGLVRLDGSGSFDGDGDKLVYKWSWVVGGEEYVSGGGDGVVNLLDFAWWAKNAGRTPAVQGDAGGAPAVQGDAGGAPAVQGDAGRMPAVRWLGELAGVWLANVRHPQTEFEGGTQLDGNHPQAALGGATQLDVAGGGPYLVIELPVGVHVVTLVVNDGVEDSEPNTCVVTVLRAGDLDGDGEVDVEDLNILLAGRNGAATGPDDPRDLDGDGMITVLDARRLVTLFTR